MQRPLVYVLVASLLCAGITFGLFVSASHATPTTGGPDADGLRSSDGTIMGQVVDRTDATPLPGATVRLHPTDRGQATDAEGRFAFEEVPAGTYEVSVSFVGYASKTTEVELGAGATVSVEVDLRPASLGLPDIVVTGAARERTTAEVYRPITALSGNELQQQLSSSVPETLQRVPGFTVQYNGPGAARPSIRGMGGDRVLMLEDGQRTGDLYQTASDHGVMMEPITAEQMEVIRGPAGMLYGSQALGGVVNVIRNDVPRVQPERTTGAITTQAASVNDGVAGGGTVHAPLGPLALRGELSARTAGNTRTPQGDLPSTDMRVLNGSIGMSWIPSWGVVGAAYRFYDNTYGVPGEFDGELIPGAHPGGVDIESTRHTIRFRAAYERPVLNFFNSAELDANVIRYDHTEIELRREGQSDFVGAIFEQTSSEANFTAHHEHEPNGVRAEGAVGVSFKGRDLTAAGNSPGTRSGSEWTAAGFVYEEFGYSDVRLQLGARYDYRDVSTSDLSDIDVTARTSGDERERIVKPVTNRTFSNVSGSVAALYDFAPAWTVGVSLSRSFRSPAIEEMYSDGPHLADFSFDIGTPDLDAEIGRGVDLFVRSNSSRFELEVAGFYNRIDNYIFYENTGLSVTIDRRGDFGRVTPVFEARNTDADFWGAEVRVQYELAPRVIVDATSSYVRATRRADDNPLPFIPPLSADVEVRYEGSRFFGHLGIRTADAQNRVPNPIERDGELERPQQPTDGYALFRAGGGAQFDMQDMRHRIVLQSENIADTTWRDHLSRVKEVAPQPGRNLSLTYRLQF